MSPHAVLRQGGPLPLRRPRNLNLACLHCLSRPFATFSQLRVCFIVGRQVPEATATQLTSEQMQIDKILRAVLVAGALLIPAGLQAQQAVPKVFIDCNARNCNQEYFRTEIDWVNWVRDRADSDVHLIFTSESMGSGGQLYQMDLIGMGSAAGYSESLRLPTLPTATEREELDQIVEAMALALAQFATVEGFRDLVTVQITSLRAGLDPTAGVVAREEVVDPWNLWTFNLSGNADLSGEDTRSNRRIRSSFSASRVSPNWKINLRGDLNYNRRQIELSNSDTDFVDSRTDWGATALVVKTVAPRVSVGFRSEARRIVSFNQGFRAEFTPAIEYSFFPYEEATRRSLTAYYQIGPAYRDYIETTVFGEEDELRWEQSATLALSQRQTWGDASIRINGSHFLHDLDLYNVSLRGDLEFRITRGLSLSTQGNVSWVQDQIYLSGEDATSEEELLDLVRRGQSFTWGFQVGFNFRFGSIFNNVVNNRFGGGGGGFGFGGGGGGGGE